MRNHIILVVFFLTNYSVFGQNIRQVKGKTILEFVTPPNGRHLYDNVFIDETEISNIAYLEYLFYLKTDSSYSFYLSQLPDSSCWQKGLQPKDSINPYAYHYFRYPGFRYYPVIGVSYDQALNYCKWRAAIVTEHFKNGNIYNKYKGLKDYDVIVEYRLPTKEEWELAASGGLDINIYPYGQKRPMKDKAYTFKIGNNSCIKCLDKNGIKYQKSNIIHKIEFNVLDNYYFDLNAKTIICSSDTSFDLGYIYDFPSNNFGLYNMIGNVSEMTNSKGIAKGGSFRNKLSDFTIKTNLFYDNPKEWLGFRCIAIVHMKRKCSY